MGSTAKATSGSNRDGRSAGSTARPADGSRTDSRVANRSGDRTARSASGKQRAQDGGGARAPRNDDVRDARSSRASRVGSNDRRRDNRGDRYDDRRANRPKVNVNVNIGRRYPRFDNHYYRKHKHAYRYCNLYHHPSHHHYVDSHVHVSSHLYLGISWPWLNRHQHHWSPRYRYRQVVIVDAGWGRRSRSARVDVRTTYRQRIVHASADYAEIDIEIESIELYQDDYYLGFVDRIPSRLKNLRATVYADGRVDFDRDVFIVGDRYAGFEMISTRSYDGYVLNEYRRGHDYRVGRLDLRRERVRTIRRSRLFDPYQIDGYVPVSLLPDDDRLWDYGYEAISQDYYFDDDYDGGYYDDYGNDDRGRRNGYAYNRSDEIAYRTNAGADVRLKRETTLERIK